MSDGVMEQDDVQSSSDPLDLTTLDSDSLFSALTAVENAIPELLTSVKPVLAHLVSGPTTSNGDEESAGIAARESVDRYMTLLDKIQFVLRQTVYYLLETKAPPHTLRPPPVNAIPTPFASTLPAEISARSSTSGPSSDPSISTTTSSHETNAAPADSTGKESEASGGNAEGSGAGSGGRRIRRVGSEGKEPDLGLYGSRLEARFLDEMIQALKRLKEERSQDRTQMDHTSGGGEGAVEADGMSVDHRPP